MRFDNANYAAHDALTDDAPVQSHAGDYKRIGDERLTDQLTQNTVRYVKNGARSRWWRSAKSNGEVHAGWSNIPIQDLLNPDFAALGHRIKPKQDFNALRTLLDSPSKHVWITFEGGSMWWCTVRDGIVANPNGEEKDRGHFWLSCDRKWSNRSIGGRLLAIADLPGAVSAVAGFRATVCEPSAAQAILRIIRDEKDGQAEEAERARAHYERVVENIVKRLSPKDFEQLIDLILVRTGWARISTLGKTREGIDLVHPLIDEHRLAGELALLDHGIAVDRAVGFDREGTDEVSHRHEYGTRIWIRRCARTWGWSRGRRNRSRWRGNRPTIACTEIEFAARRDGPD